ncbi:type VI secretion system baseplate subunit TssF [Flavobacterium amniphilum]|uniref:type VI secretion system baseplate subunit TssF n=1 Tax=Flavobacterium amniphilum TaxID=1834035 RepID=UPI00202A44DB|nr:type VI secretion system baseplate subunit TssF [Flavobacterium amniphilum]MCL9805335.1 type VI secretion system baseplate subunit TssF [Flavobacterium amniphilum]
MEIQERVKDRILKRAARVWGYSDSELETSFDPIVALLLEACAAELEKLSVELNNSHARIVERLIEVMSPASNAGAMPSRSIIHAKPSENNFRVSLEHQFYCKKNIPNIYDPVKPTVKEVFFGPTGSFDLSTADVEFMAFGNSMYNFTRNVHKEFYLKSAKSLKSSTIWIGLRCLEPNEILKKLMFYVDVKNTHQREVFYHYLKQSKIFLGDKQLGFKEGYNVATKDLDIDAVITKNYNRINQIYSEVNKFYFDKFIHLTDDIVLDPSLLKVPAEIASVFENDKLNSLNDVLWLRVEFPEVINNSIFESLSFSLNSFPVINKRLINLAQRIDPYINYIPLVNDDHFLDLDTITDSRGFSYHLKQFSQNLEGGEAALRNNGVERFDERNASEIIQYLLELLKDESASFSVLGGDFVRNVIAEMNQLIATLEQQTKENSFLKSNFPYVVIKSNLVDERNENDSFFINFWSTCGEDANDIKPGTKLDLPFGTDFFANTIYLVQPSVGGKTRLTSNEKILSYRQALLSHGRVVTFADIKTFCLKHFGHTISHIEVNKGTKADPSLKAGFVRTIDIKVDKNEESDIPFSDNEWNYLCDNLLHKLDQVSSNIYPYRLLVS